MYGSPHLVGVAVREEGSCTFSSRGHACFCRCLRLVYMVKDGLYRSRSGRAFEVCPLGLGGKVLARAPPTTRAAVESCKHTTVLKFSQGLRSIRYSARKEQQPEACQMCQQFHQSPPTQAVLQNAVAIMMSSSKSVRRG